MKNENKKVKILIVEDELIVAKNIESQLQRLGYEVPGSASSGLEAIALAERYRPKLILMDIKLSGEMDGITAADIIRRRFRIPVVYLTAYADHETLQRAKSTEPFGYILKPFELRNLHSTIEIALYKNQLENQLVQSELRFRTLAESSPVGIFQSDENGDCVYVNKSWCEMAGISPAQAMGRGWMAALHPDDREAIAAQWYGKIQSGEVFELEYRFQTPTGNITWVFGRAVALKIDPELKNGYIGSFTDITVRKKLEEELLVGRKLESIGILAGGIAHDFNNLLSVIMGTISLMKEDSAITKEQYRMLVNMEKSSVQASELAQKLITFSKGGWLNRKKMGIPALIDELVLEQFTQTRSLFRVDFPSDLSAIDGDWVQLKQVFSNLLLNAVEAGSDRENEIFISGRNIGVTPEEMKAITKPGAYVKITVRDTGEGISRENLEKIFDPYFSTKEKGCKKGMGLGMSICYSIIQKHGGFIEVRSEVCCGTTVDVYLPAYSDEAIPLNEASKKTPEAPVQSRVLIMDDEPVVLDVTCKMVQRLGFVAERFSEGGKAVEAYKKGLEEKQPFDVVLLDLINKMGMGGNEALQQILEINPAVKAIALSGYADTGEIERLKSCGFCEVLVKPYKLSDLKEILDRFCLKRA
ncbi:MAG: response regulator [Candidatus Omnitrophota bacterium]